MYEDKQEKEDENNSQKQEDLDPHVKIRIKQQQSQPMLNYLSKNSLQVDRSKFDIEEEKKDPEPQ